MRLTSVRTVFLAAGLMMCRGLAAAQPVQPEVDPSVPAEDETAVSSETQTGVAGVPAPPGVTKIDVREEGLFAELYLPTQRSGPLPALMAIGGSEGGLQASSRTHVSFAGEGFAVLALAYWREPGLPATLERVPLEYFHTAINWLKQRPEVDPGRLGLMGGSRGAEAALLIASREQDIHAVVAVSPSSHVREGWNFGRPAGPAWTAAGRPVPYAALQLRAFGGRGRSLGRMDAYLEAGRQHPEAAIPVERINGPILLLSGGDDHVWPSGEMAELIMQRLKKAGFTHASQHLAYKGAGHIMFVGDPSRLSPAAIHSYDTSRLGGSARASMAAWSDDWIKTLQFLKQSLAP